jgi:hypothetical protein
VSEAQEETKVRSRITVWSVALGTSLHRLDNALVFNTPPSSWRDAL